MKDNKQPCENISFLVRCGLLSSLMLLGTGVPSEPLAAGFIVPEAVTQPIKECAGPRFNTLACARGIEKTHLAKKNHAVTRVKDTLKIQLAKRTVRVTDATTKNGDKLITYSYLGFDNKLNIHIILVQREEGDGYMVIHHYSGQRALPSGYPLASPDGKNFLSLSEDLTAGNGPNNIEIWRISAGQFSKDANFEPEWGPHTGRWLDSGHVQIAKRCYAPTERNNAELRPCGEAKVEYSKARWKLVE
jgi:hypothetical protein